MKKLTALDSLFLTMESSKAPTHAGIVQIFDLPARAGTAYTDRVYDAFLKTEPAAPFNCYPDMKALTGPCWREAENFDASYHVRRIALPSPGTDEQLMTLVSQLYSGMLDRRLPLWECYIIDGLQDNRFAIFSKVHHAYGDGMSGAKAMYETLNDKPQTARITPIWAYEKIGTSKRPIKKTNAAARLEKSISGAVSQISELSAAGVEAVKTGAQTLGFLPKDSGSLFNAHKNSLHKPFYSGARSFSCGSIPLDTVKSIARQYDATVNDVVMTICDHAMVQYLSEKGETPREGLTGMMAVSTRSRDDQSSSNQAAFALTKLGDPDIDIVTRLQQVNLETTAVKDRLRSKSSNTLFLSNMMQILSTEIVMKTPALQDRLSPNTNLFVSNIPGLTGKLKYLGSARMTGVYTAPIVQEGIPLNITLASYHDQLCFGFGAASEVMPDVAHYASLTLRAFEALEKMATGKKSQRVTARKNSRKQKAAA